MSEQNNKQEVVRLEKALMDVRLHEVADTFGYKSLVSDHESVHVEHPLMMRSIGCDLRYGLHPKHVAQAMSALSPLYNSNESPVDSMLTIPPYGSVWGHHYMMDSGLADQIETFHQVPISPSCVKDLAGRVIAIGLAAPNQSEELAITFPEGCDVVPDNSQLAEQIEQRFCTAFRSLDQSHMLHVSEDENDEKAYVLAYPSANLYPYKLRLDTFYIDGWKVPQTQMVFAKTQGISIEKAQNIASGFIERWKARPEGQTYEEFYAANDGETWFEEMFLQGCTVIPTLEACNGFNKVSADFQLEDFWPGRAVEGLHSVVEEIESDAPTRTILEVVEPGYVLSEKVYPAKVIVSNGKNYHSPHNNPAPTVPYLKLPHQRTSSIWGATWLPTHPAHFESPAIWGWDGSATNFVQLSGPLWDPLHYYYTSVDKVIRAFKEPIDGNRWCVKVPEDMKLTFHPIAPMMGFDVISHQALAFRKQNEILPRCAIARIPKNEATCGVGYHPLPLEFEFELDNWWFPELSPRLRVDPNVPDFLKEYIAPVISSKIKVSEYVEKVNGTEDTAWVTNTENMHEASGELFGDYPHLKRYLEECEPEEIVHMSNIYLEYIPNMALEISAKELWGDLKEDFSNYPAGFEKNIWEARQNALDDRKLRQRVYKESRALYIMAWWEGIFPDDLEAYLNEQNQKTVQS